jgi:cyclopropane-fatty-acyl-phospholipid synthase
MGKLFQAFFSGLIKTGSMEIETAEGRHFVVGDGSGEKVALRFNDRAAQIRFMVDPELSFGELYMDGRIDVTKGSLYDALMLAAENLMRPDIGPLRPDGSG